MMSFTSYVCFIGWNSLSSKKREILLHAWLFLLNVLCCPIVWFCNIIGALGLISELMDICIQQTRLITLLEEIYILKVANFTLFSTTDHACALLKFGLNLSVLGKPGSAFKHHDVWVAAEVLIVHWLCLTGYLLMIAGARISCWYLSSKVRNLAPDTTVSTERCLQYKYCSTLGFWCSNPRTCASVTGWQSNIVLLT